MSEDDVFVIALKRERRNEVPPDWVELVRGTSGVTILGDSNPSRIQVRASPEAIQQLRDRLSENVHIEKVIPHRLT
jgi:hypothetical protein